MNLRIFDLEVLEQLPQRTHFADYLKGTWCKRGSLKHYYNGGRKIPYHTVDYILKDSVGKHYDKILKRVCDKWKSSWTTSRCDTPKGALSTKTDQIIPTSLGYKMFGDYGRLKEINIITHWPNDFYFDENKILQCKKIEPKVKVKDLSTVVNEWRRKHLRSQKEAQHTGKTLITLINNPSLYKFYCGLIANKRRLITTIEEKPRAYPIIKYTNVVYEGRPYRRVEIQIDDPMGNFRKEIRYWKAYERIRINNIKKAEAQLHFVENDIAKIEAKDYTPYYQSPGYLFSIGKDCPHFEQP